MARPTGRTKQLELICEQCPLSDCNSDSLWCIYSFLTTPNEAQKALMKTDRKEYFAERYQRRKQEAING